MITEQGAIAGSGKGTPGWIEVDRVNVSYDHPAHMTIEHTLNIDFVNESGALGDRVAVELTRQSARRLVDLSAPLWSGARRWMALSLSRHSRCHRSEAIELGTTYREAGVAGGRRWTIPGPST